MKAAVIQLVSGMDQGANLSAAARLMSDAASAGAELLVLPENFALMESPALIALGEQERYSNGPVRRFLAEQARDLKAWIVAGSLPCAERPDGSELSDRVRSVCRVYSPEGQERLRYDKVHLFDVDVGDQLGVYRESDRFEAGDAIAMVDLPEFRLGLTICYDLRFPGLYQALRQKGMQVVTVPSAFTWKTGMAHWEVLLRARAVENQCYVLAANQGGIHSEKRRTWGHSMIVDPWGGVLAEVEADGEGFALADLSTECILQTRKRMRMTPAMLRSEASETE